VKFFLHPLRALRASTLLELTRAMNRHLKVRLIRNVNEAQGI
jgi:hypothetical protein